jgi:hypothetical protein
LSNTGVVYGEDVILEQRRQELLQKKQHMAVLQNIYGFSVLKNRIEEETKE